MYRYPTRIGLCERYAPNLERENLLQILITICAILLMYIWSTLLSLSRLTFLRLLVGLIASVSVTILSIAQQAMTIF